MDKKAGGIPLPDNEAQRLAKLRIYNIAEYEQSGAFQHVATMAARIFKVPIAFVNFVESKSVLINASVGITGLAEVKRELGLCSLAVLQDEVTVIKNTRDVEELLANPLIADFGLQFYAGAPVKTPDGLNIGVVAIADKRPREFTAEDEKILEGLAAVVMEELEERLAHRSK
ncbi:MAG TPA: GAF domain-containing protein [Pontibacter sp.]